MVDDMEKNVLCLIGKASTLTVLVSHAFFKIIRIGDNLKRGPLVFIMDVLPIFQRMHIPYPKFTGNAQQPVIPDMVGIQYVAKKPFAVFRYFLQITALLNQFFVTIKIVIEELLQKSLHTPSVY
jgi:hypothetical protein